MGATSTAPDALTTRSTKRTGAGKNPYGRVMQQEANDLNPIEVTRLEKRYGDLKAVMTSHSTLIRGKSSVLGPNGAGKTTTIEILEGLRERDGGDTKVLGFDPWKNGYDLHKRIGVIPQEFNFIEKITPREAIIYYADLFNIKVNPDDILKEVLLEESAKTYFDSLFRGAKTKNGAGSFSCEFS